MIFRLSSAYKNVYERKMWDIKMINDDVKDDLKQALGIILKERRRENNKFNGFSQLPVGAFTYAYYIADRATLGLYYLVESVFSAMDHNEFVMCSSYTT